MCKITKCGRFGLNMRSGYVLYADYVVFTKYGDTQTPYTDVSLPIYGCQQFPICGRVSCHIRMIIYLQYTDVCKF